jgi:putative oxidoreductase
LTHRRGQFGFFFNNPNGGWEFPAFWIVVLLVQALIGEGAYSVAAIRDTAVRGTLKTASSQ